MLETSAGTAGRRAGALLAVCAASIGLLAGPAAPSAWADDTATTFAVQASVAKAGTLQVKETVTFTGQGPAQLTQRFEIRENSTGDRQYVQRVSGVTATARGKALPVTTKTDDPYTTVTVDTGGAGEVQVSYTVTGTVITSQGGGTALRWGLLQGLSVPVDRFSATVQVPSSISYVACTAGSPNSTTPCGSASGGTEGTQNPTFTDGPRGQGEVVAVDIGFPAGAVTADERIEHRWTVGRAFSADPLPLALALGLLLLGGLALWALHRRNGRDLAATGPITRAGEFVPTGAGESEFRVVGEVRPGHVGTVVDERVDPIDVTASLVDLAVRGHLLITELPRPTAYAPTDWTLTRQGGATDDALNPFETRLLDAIAPVGSSLRVSELSGRVQDSIGAVQDDLYDEMVQKGWYERRPDATRNRWAQLGLLALIVAVVVTGVLAAFSTFGLVGLALVVLALGLVFVGQEMPSRTAKGAALLAGLGALRSDLLSHPTDQMPRGRELRELSEVLPYAVVLGGADRWLDAIVATDLDAGPDPTDLSWYHGPPDWHLRDLPGSLRNFLTTVSGSLFSR